MGIRHSAQPAATLPIKPNDAPGQPARCRHLGSRCCHYSRQPLHLLVPRTITSGVATEVATGQPHAYFSRGYRCNGSGYERDVCRAVGL